VAELRITQVRSTIGSKPKTKGTVRALGLRRIGMTRTVPDRPEMRGMLARVAHLVDFEPVGGPDGSRQDAPGQGPAAP
jgi:large subunit ribosomal protein L30